MKIAEQWKRSADSAAAVHQIRNRLQSIIIEAALLKRANQTADATPFARIGALAQDGASFLEVFNEITPPPDIDGQTNWHALQRQFEEAGVEFVDDDLSVKCESNALAAMMQMLVCDAIPVRGFRCTKASALRTAGGRIEVRIELKAATAVESLSLVSPWLTVQQMVRDLGGSMELHSGDPPTLKMMLPGNE
jgi:hypothetical protein